MDQILKYIPESLFILLVLIGGIVFFFYDSPLTSVCDVQISDYIRSQRGRLLPRAVKVKNPTTGDFYKDNLLQRSRKQCIQSLEGMGCARYFKIIKQGLNDFKKLDRNCLTKLSKKPFLFKIIGQYLQTMTRLAWGKFPPQSQEMKTSWLSHTDIQTFCKAKSYYKTFYSKIYWGHLVKNTLTQVMTSPQKKSYKDSSKNLSSISQNKEKKPLTTEKSKETDFKFKKASMKPQKAFDLSLLSLNCLIYK